MKKMPPPPAPNLHVCRNCDVEWRDYYRESRCEHCHQVCGLPGSLRLLDAVTASTGYWFLPNR